MGLSWRYLLHLCMRGALGCFNEHQIQERDNEKKRCNDVRNCWWWSLTRKGQVCISEQRCLRPYKPENPSLATEGLSLTDDLFFVLSFMHSRKWQICLWVFNPRITLIFSCTAVIATLSVLLYEHAFTVYFSPCPQSGAFNMKCYQSHLIINMYIYFSI